MQHVAGFWTSVKQRREGPLAGLVHEPGPQVLPPARPRAICRYSRVAQVVEPAQHRGKDPVPALLV